MTRAPLPGHVDGVPIGPTGPTSTVHMMDTREPCLSPATPFTIGEQGFRRRERTMATDLEQFVEPARASRSGGRGCPSHRRRGHHLRVLPVRLRHRPGHGQGHPRGPLASVATQGVPAGLRRHGQPVHRPPRPVPRLRPRGGRAGRPARRRHLLPTSLGSQSGPGLLHPLPGSGGRGRPWGLLELGLPWQPASPPSASSPRRRDCTYAPGASPR